MVKPFHRVTTADLPDEEQVPLSVLLRTLADSATDTLTVGDITTHFGPRALGALLFVFALPNLLPLPPGSTTLLGLPLIFFAPQLALGSAKPWLPKRLMRLSFSPHAVRKLCDMAASRLEWAERLSTRRWGFMLGRAGAPLIGVVCTLLACVLILPIPLGNLLPALTIAVLGLSLFQRDGVMALIGYGLASASAGALILAAGLVVAMFGQVVSWATAVLT